MTNTSVFGSLNNLNDTVIVPINDFNGVGFTVTTENFTATVVAEVSYDNAVNWFTTYFYLGGQGQIFNFFGFSGTTAISGGSIAFSGGATHARLRVSSAPTGNATAIMVANNTLGNLTTIQPGNVPNTTPWLVDEPPANLVVTSTATTGSGVTITLPAVASRFHYITNIELTKYFTAANAASATPLVVTTTNLPGSLAFTFGQPLGTIGTSESRVIPLSRPMRSSVVNTDTTIVCPATTGIIWRATANYYTAA